MRTSIKIASSFLAVCLLASCSSSQSDPGTIEKPTQASNSTNSNGESDSDGSISSDFNTVEDEANASEREKLINYVKNTGRLDSSKVKGKLLDHIGALKAICSQLLNASLDPYTLQDTSFGDVKLEFDDAMKEYYNKTDSSKVYILASKGRPEITKSEGKVVMKYEGLLASSPYLSGNDARHTAREISKIYASSGEGETLPYPIIFTFTENKGSTKLSLTIDN